MTDLSHKLRATQVRSSDITSEYSIDELAKDDYTIRVYTSSPGAFSLQLRTRNKPTRRSKERRILATADYLDLEDIDWLIDALNQARHRMIETGGY